MSHRCKENNTKVLHWLSESCIHEDLSIAQGRLPVKMKGTALRAGEKPPDLNIKEETEEEYFKLCGGDGEVATAPDLRMIQQMLDMVREESTELQDENLSGKCVIITKPHLTGQPDTPIQTAPINDGNTTPVQPIKIERQKKPKRQRNFAIELLLQAIDKDKTEKATACNEITVLKKPDDFLSTNNVADVTGETKQTHPDPAAAAAETAIKKVTDWIDTPKTSPFPKKTTRIYLESSSLMFKKKSVAKEPVKSTITKPLPTYQGNEYKPSEKVHEYYKKFMEQKKIKELAREDIWDRAEREMREIDKRRLVAKVCKESCNGTEDCIVLDALNKRETALESKATLGNTSLDIPYVTNTEDISSCTKQDSSAEDNMAAKDNVDVKYADSKSTGKEDAEQVVNVDKESEINIIDDIDSRVPVAQLIDIGGEPEVCQDELISMNDENINMRDNKLPNDLKIK